MANSAYASKESSRKLSPPKETAENKTAEVSLEGEVAEDALKEAVTEAGFAEILSVLKPLYESS